jgi:hypothetical protein
MFETIRDISSAQLQHQHMPNIAFYILNIVLKDIGKALNRKYFHFFYFFFQIFILDFRLDNEIVRKYSTGLAK